MNSINEPRAVFTGCYTALCNTLEASPGGADFVQKGASDRKLLLQSMSKSENNKHGVWEGRDEQIGSASRKPLFLPDAEKPLRRGGRKLEGVDRRGGGDAILEKGEAFL